MSFFVGFAAGLAFAVILAGVFGVVGIMAGWGQPALCGYCGRALDDDSGEWVDWNGDLR